MIVTGLKWLWNELRVRVFGVEGQVVSAHSGVKQYSYTGIVTT
jgi:hypothetical protein